MSTSVDTLIEYAEHVYGRVNTFLAGISDEELNWRPCQTCNTLGWTLRHMARVSVVLLPPVVEGTTTGRWEDDYESRPHTLDELIRDLNAGRDGVISGLRGMAAGDLEEEIPLWGGVHRRKEGLYMLIGELAHHGGQVAYIRGAYSRTRR